jgi:hypothetical protein
LQLTRYGWTFEVGMHRSVEVCRDNFNRWIHESCAAKTIVREQ